MMSLAAVQRVSRDAAIRAARYKQVPLVFEYEDLLDFKARLKAGDKFQFRLPFLGDLVPPGWKYTDRERLFVDATGSGLDNEPALPWRAFFEAVRVGFGYAVVEARQFQAYVREFERDDSAPGNEREFVGLTSNEEAEFNEVVKQEEAQFDSAKMEQTAERLLQEGRMPQMDEFLQAVAEEQKRVQKASGPQLADVQVTNQGSVVLFKPLTNAGLRFIKQYLWGESFTGEHGVLVVEWRYAADLAAGMREAGLRLDITGGGFWKCSK